MAAIPKVSVVIPIYGKSGDLPRLVEALLGQSLQPHEIILVDSSPQPMEAPPHGTRLVKNPVDVALSWDYNLGAKAATAEATPKATLEISSRRLRPTRSPRLPMVMSSPASTKE